MFKNPFGTQNIQSNPSSNDQPENLIAQRLPCIDTLPRKNSICVYLNKSIITIELADDEIGPVILDLIEEVIRPFDAKDVIFDIVGRTICGYQHDKLILFGGETTSSGNSLQIVTVDTENGKPWSGGSLILYSLCYQVRVA